MASEGKNKANLLSDVDPVVHEPSRYNIAALLYVLESADFVFVQRQTGLTPGNLSAHIRKLADAGYVKIDKGFAGNFPRTNLTLTAEGRRAFEKYRENMKRVLDNLPEQ